MANRLAQYEWAEGWGETADMDGPRVRSTAGGGGIPVKVVSGLGAFWVEHFEQLGTALKRWAKRLAKRTAAALGRAMRRAGRSLARSIRGWFK